MTNLSIVVVSLDVPAKWLVTRMKRIKLARWVGCSVLVVMMRLPVSGQQPHPASFPQAPAQKYASQKGLSKSGVATLDAPPHRRWCGAHPPLAPVLQPAAVLRVDGPPRQVRLRVEQESGREPEPEAGLEREHEMEQLKADIKRLDQRVHDLFQSLQLLVQKLGE